MDSIDFKIQVLPVRQKIFRIAKRMLHSKEEAEDTVLDVFLKLWQKRYTLLNYNSIEALAVTMTKYLCLDKLKAGRNIFLMLSKDYSPDYEPVLMFHSGFAVISTLFIY